MVTSITPENRKLMIMATYGSVAVAIVLAIIKFATWIATDSMSIQASFTDSMVDSVASLVNFFAVRQAVKPADKEHKFGHGKIEALAAQAQAIFIAGTALWLIFDGIHRFIQPEPIQKTELGIFVTLFTLVVTIALVLFQRHVIRKTKSLIIKADSLHFSGDVFINLSVLAALILAHYLQTTWIDTVCGVSIGIYILFAASKISQESFNMLVDRELPDDEVDLIEKAILSHPKVRGFHDLKTRTSGPHKFIQLHLELDGSMPLFEAHTISIEVANILYKTIPGAEITIHEDPFDDRHVEKH